MNYRIYGATGKKISEMGFGSTRLNPEDLNDEAGLNRCAELVVKASDLGINYFDIAHNYAKSQCEQIFRLAFKIMKNPYFVTSKSSSFQENTADDVLRRIESSLNNLDVDKIDFFYLWSIMDEEHYIDIMKPGGAYEGARIAQNRGLIKHIVFSNHATPQTAIKIINDGYFEGITISYSLLNHSTMEAVVSAAYQQNMGITVMNPLAGGIIPQNEELFASVFKSSNLSLAQSALRFTRSNPKITSVLSGVANEDELNENLVSFSTDFGDETNWKRLITDNFSEIGGLCTGCGYCRFVCPSGIQIPEMMQSYNMSLFKQADKMYGRTNRTLLKKIATLKKIILDFKIQPISAENLCIQCGQCEKICTQHLPIIRQLNEIYQWIDSSAASTSHYKKRLEDLLIKPNYQKVAFYTAGGYTAKVLLLLEGFFGKPSFEIVIFDSNANRWGDLLNGYPVENPDHIERIRPDCIIISNYNFEQEIYDSLLKYEDIGIKVQKLHESEDVPWVF